MSEERRVHYVKAFSSGPEGGFFGDEDQKPRQVTEEEEEEMQRREEVPGGCMYWRPILKAAARTALALAQTKYSYGNRNWELTVCLNDAVLVSTIHGVVPANEDQIKTYTFNHTTHPDNLLCIGSRWGTDARVRKKDMSRLHAVVLVTAQGFHVVDMGSWLGITHKGEQKFVFSFGCNEKVELMLGHRKATLHHKLVAASR
jgi:hypothetical protein